MPSRTSSRRTDPAAAGRDLTRRHFLQNCCAAVGTTGMLSALSQLRLIGAVTGAGPSSGVAAASGEDYRALVCIFLGGGNDSNNTIVPYDTAAYAAYAAARGPLALPRSTLRPITPRTTDGRSWGLHPVMEGADQLFAGGKLAIMANVGTLCAPTSRNTWMNGTVPLPPQLFSHNDQSGQWQSSVPDKPLREGWGGRMADIVNSANGAAGISMSISLDGGNLFQVGKSVAQFAIQPSGVAVMEGRSTDLATLNGIRSKVQNELLGAQNPNLFETAFAGITADAIDDSRVIGEILAGEANPTTVFPDNNPLAAQLKMIAKLIKVRAKLGLKRQIFFARMGGWDTHQAQLSGDGTIGAHAYLLWSLSSALKSFYDATVELGVADQVTAFTASDFGRTYGTNGDGSDHGWGGHHFIVGGAVKGGDIYGKMHDHTMEGPDDTYRGRWIPSTSVDEYSATLARWFGVSDSDLSVVLPNLGRFAKRDLGFMTT